MRYFQLGLTQHRPIIMVGNPLTYTLMGSFLIEVMGICYTYPFSWVKTEIDKCQRV